MLFFFSLAVPDFPDLHLDWPVRALAWSQWCVFTELSKGPLASDHSAVIVANCLVFSSARAAPHNIIQQDAVYILLALCWPDSKAVILIMVCLLGLDSSNRPLVSAVCLLCCSFTGGLS